MSIIPKLLREIRIEKGWTQNYVAGMMDISGVTAVGRVRGETSPTLNSLEKWAAALGYEIDLMLIREKESAK